MSEAEHPDRRGAAARREVTVEEIRTLVAAATPHFALQVRNRVARLVDGLPDEHPARREARRQVARLTELGRTGEVRGAPAQPGMAPLRSLRGRDDATGGVPAGAEPSPSGRAATPGDGPAPT